jgi:hypothetical protein
VLGQQNRLVELPQSFVCLCADYRGCGYMLLCTYVHHTASDKLRRTPTLRVSNACIFSLESRVYFTTYTKVTVSATCSSQMSLCPWFLFCVTKVVVWPVHQIIFIFRSFNVANESPFFQNMPCVTGWLQHNVWMKHTGLIFKDHMSSDDGPLKMRLLHWLQMSPSHTILEDLNQFLH